MAEPQQQTTQLIVGAVGRPFTLGMLYHAPKEELVPGLSLWDQETLQGLTAKKPQRSCNFDICASDSTKNNNFSLNVSAALQLSFLSGLVEVGGSANYKNDQKEFKNQSRVTLQYSATTVFEQLSLTSTQYDQIQKYKILDKGLATHVVTGIEYGANAFFVFDSQKVEASEVETVKGQMEATIKKIPGCGIHGSAELKLTNEEQTLVDSFSVKFYGDFLLESNPATFKAAVDTYSTLPQLLIGPDKEVVNSVPVRIWMLPLEAFELSRADIPDNGISVGLVLEAENTLEELSDVQLRCNDSLPSRAVGKFPQLHHKLLTFHKLCQHYRAELQREMAEKCPAIREGTLEESALREVFKKRDSSAFSQVKLTQWLQDTEREINVIDSILDILSPVPQDEKVFLQSKSDYRRAKRADYKATVLSTQSEVDRLVLAPGDDVRVGYIFTNVHSSDPQLEEMIENLNMLRQGKPYVGESTNTMMEKQWFYNDDLLTHMRQMAKGASNPFVAAIPIEGYTGAALVTYQDGVQVSIQGAKDYLGVGKGEQCEQ